MTTRRIEPIAGTLDSKVRLPGSKSITNRALVAAALAAGSSTLDGAGLGDDIEAMVECLTALGSRFEFDGTRVRVEGVAGRPVAPDDALNARQSGTTARFVLPLLALAGSGVLDGHEQMRARPMADLASALRQLGAELDGDVLPIRVHVPARLGSSAVVGSEVSSQFVSGLLLAAPCLPDGLELTMAGEPVSSPYIAMTIAVMGAFGAEIDREGARITVAGSGYRAAEYRVEPDASTATYPLAAAAIVGGRVVVDGVGSQSVQGDVGFAHVLRDMGADVYLDPDRIEIRGGGPLHAVDADLGDISDTAPTFAAVAARAVGRSAATGIGFIRETKESDRVAASVTELRRLGIEASIDDDGFSVTGGPHRHAVVSTYDDHRMAMALSLLGLVDEPVTIENPDCVAKTFPGFYDMLDALRAEARPTPLVLAIDGPAGSGKSTVARQVSSQLRLPHLDTGAMYRSVTLAVLRSGVSIDNEDAVTLAAERSEIGVSSTRVTIDGVDVTTAIRSPEVTSAVSPVAAIAGVRHVLAERQR